MMFEEYAKLAEENRQLAQRNERLERRLDSAREDNDRLRERIKQLEEYTDFLKAQNERLMKMTPVTVTADITKTAKTGKRGRPQTIDDQTRKKAVKLRRGGYSVRKIAELLNISIGSVTNITNNS